MPTKSKINKTAELTESEALAAFDASVRDGADVLGAYGAYRRAVTYASARRNHTMNEDVRIHNVRTEPVRRLIREANELESRYIAAKAQRNVATGVLSGHTATAAEVEATRQAWIAKHREVGELIEGELVGDLDDENVTPRFVSVPVVFAERKPFVSASTLRSGVSFAELYEKALSKAESAWAAAAVAEV